MSTSNIAKSVDRITSEVEFLRLALLSMASESYGDPSEIPLAAKGMIQSLGRIGDELALIERDPDEQ